ncbi:MAG: hypothetical protein ACRC4L_03185 [Mycoplasma sp.]
MSFIKKVFKSTFGIAGVALSVAGLGLTVAGAVMIPTSANEKMKIEDQSVGIGTSNFYIFYFKDGTSIISIDGEVIMNPTKKQIKQYYEFLKKIYQVKTIKEVAKKIAENTKNDEELGIGFKKAVQNFDINAWGVTLAIIGPVSLLSGVGLAYYSFKKSNKGSDIVDKDVEPITEEPKKEIKETEKENNTELNVD